MSPLRSSAGPATRADADAELLAHDVREARLAEARRADEQHVVERLAARLRGAERDPELLLDVLLPDEVVEEARAERLLELLLLAGDHRCQELVLMRRSGARGARALRPASVRIDLGERALGSTSE